jgi:hypothetical protein
MGFEGENFGSVSNGWFEKLIDLQMDWGLFDKNAGDNTLLREEIVYSSSVRVNSRANSLRANPPNPLKIL